MSVGRMPAYVSLSERAIVTAGLAKEVDEVNQYPAVTYAARANGINGPRVRPTQITTPINPQVATPSPSSLGKPVRIVVAI